LRSDFEDSLELQAVILLARADGAGDLRCDHARDRRPVKQDLFRSRLDEIIDMKQALVKLARAIDWGFLEQTFRAVYTDKPFCLTSLAGSTRALLGLAGETVLAAVPWLRFSAKARRLDLTIQQAVNRSRPIRSNRSSP
jgi:hypothetical protein